MKVFEASPNVCLVQYNHVFGAVPQDSVLESQKCLLSCLLSMRVKHSMDTCRIQGSCQGTLHQQDQQDVIGCKIRYPTEIMKLLTHIGNNARTF